ncbi:MAG: alpha-glucan family phosphorylase [Candidatus Nitronauta litoralis]|uniref:glycogen phosphorylase n=1 Tax=Candidatus Nitronauta litoralis TaxID=2705533 RepID=A0A7T0BU25_9BACT|nr:MAG: alpha-glucan family phosphorylase [Candidatus Nitronauta litoralis]
MNSSVIEGDLYDPKIAYFSMEIGLETQIPTYSGGLGVLAGDTLKSCADLGLPTVGLTLLYRQGYFRQEINAEGRQVERPVEWDPSEKLILLPEKIVLNEIEGRDILVQAWVILYRGIRGDRIPILFLDTCIEGNRDEDKELCSSLYSGNREFRLKQEILLGIGGVKFLRALRFHNIRTFHMNEGHSSLLTVELLRENQRALSETWDETAQWDLESVRSNCVFTTHTPVAAGHDRFPFDLVERVLKTEIPLDLLRELSGEDQLNMTTLGLNLSRFANGVAKRHGEVSKEMFPLHLIDFITNGIHTYTWVHDQFGKLFNQHIPLWREDPRYLRQAEILPEEEVWDAHLDCKRELLEHLPEGAGFDPNLLTLGFARRAAAYKRANLMFQDPNRLIKLAEDSPGLQIVFAGKAHPKDEAGKEIIHDIHEKIAILQGRSKKLKIVYLPDYTMDLGFAITGGVDVWVNNPIRPYEASGTSGMKAVLNGIPNLSILDGWWVEGCIEGVTGWAIGGLDPHSELPDEERDVLDANALYDKLEQKVIPTYYQDRPAWVAIMRHAIALNASQFHTQRQMEQYVTKAYFRR